MKNVHIEVLTRAALDEPSFAEKVWRMIVVKHPDLRPSRFGSDEPLRNKVAGEFNVRETIALWQNPMLWSNGRRASGTFWFGSDRVHSSISIDCTATRISAAVLVELVCDLADFTQADFSHIDYRYVDEAEWSRRYHALYPMTLGPTTHELRRSIPELPWVVVFGPPYVDLFTRPLLAACPVYESRAVGESRWMIRLTECPPRPGAAAEYEVVRAQAKQFLGLEHFLDLARPNAQQKAPAFEWSPEVRNPLLDYLRERNLLKE